MNILVQKGQKVKGRAQVLTSEHPTYDKKHNVLYDMAGDSFPFDSIIDVTIDSSSPIIAPSYFLKPDETVATKVENAIKSYSIKSR